MENHKRHTAMLHRLGWSDYFADQVTLDDLDQPTRITAVHRSRIDGLQADTAVSLSPSVEAGLYAVGDWVLASGASASAPLQRKTILMRRAAGVESKSQLIAANVDTLAIVTSCNADFSLARLERYLAMCGASGCDPLIVLTKIDLVEDVQHYVKRIKGISADLQVICVNAKNSSSVDQLRPWCEEGYTLALVGSSGVGKTTLQNHLTGVVDDVGAIRAGDAKGRHTTTNRNMRPTLNGGWLIDTPGMRELRLLEAAPGIEDLFADITNLAQDCKFNDCSHETEPDCAVRAAISNGLVEADKLERWRKLDQENRLNTETRGAGRGRTKHLQKRFAARRSSGRPKSGR